MMICQIIEKLGVISEGKSGVKEFNIIKWYNKKAKYDIRLWKGDKAGKGITLTKEEIKVLKKILDNIEIE